MGRKTDRRTVAPFSIEREQHERITEIAKESHRSLTAHLRFLIEQEIRAWSRKESA